MTRIKTFLFDDHRRCDDLFAAVEQAISKPDWERASTAFASLHSAMEQHFIAEETILFPAFEARTGMSRGPTEVMRVEHAQMRELLSAAQQSLQAKDADDYAGNAETLLIMMQQHNMKEEHVLYPMCDDHLQDQTDALLASMGQKLQQARGYQA
jgi:hemerythrin-like domain-containing protein